MWGLASRKSISPKHFAKGAGASFLESSHTDTDGLIGVVREFRKDIVVFDNKLSRGHCRANQFLCSRPEWNVVTL
jgi:hypothetical protein